MDDLFAGASAPGYLVALALGGAIATAINPIIDLLVKLWRLIRWLGVGTLKIIKRLLGGRPTPPPPPQPGPIEIPIEKTIWEERAPINPTFPNKQGVPIIAVANMKGGVGKTTIAANLAMYFKSKTAKPVLLIDFDYQGSLSQMLQRESNITKADITAHLLVCPPSPETDPSIYAREMRRGLEDVFLYPTTYPFATIENNLMAQWMRDGQSDLMYRLCAILKRAEYQEKYGVIIIDCPPRLTTGSINALCASTHLLVPTTLDEMSAQAAEFFLSQISRMHQTVFPALRVIGIVPSIVYQNGDFLLGEKRTRKRLLAYGKEFWSRDDFVLLDGFIPRIADISNHAGTGVAYLRSVQARKIFDRLGAEVEKRL